MREAQITHRGTVYPWQCDHMGHMNVMWYVGKFDEATWQLFSALGLTPSFLRRENRGMAAVDRRLSYKRELYAGDVITVRTEVLEVKEKSLRFAHEMRRDEDGEIAATTILVGVHLDTTVRRACSFPDTLRHAAQQWLSADPSRWG